MTSEQLRRLHQARPFQPFRMHLADGRHVRVDHPELLTLSPSGRTAAVYTHADAAEIVDLLLVTSLKPTNTTSPKRRR